MRRLALAVSAVCISMASGCASIMGSQTQPLRVEAFDTAGNEVIGADCRMSNGSQEFRVVTPGSVVVKRAYGNMNVTCQKAEQPDGKGTIVSTMHPLMLGNILFGGVIGIAIDAFGGAGWTYPQWVQVAMGKLLNYKESDATGLAVAREGDKIVTVAAPAAAGATSAGSDPAATVTPSASQQTSGAQASTAQVQPTSVNSGNQGATGMAR